MLCPSVVGRAGELSTLSAALDALRQGRGGCCFFVGEPGIGKSRLAAEAVAAAQREGVWVLSGRAHPTCQAAPYQSLSGALLQGLRSRPVAEVTDPLIRAGLAALVPGIADRPAPDPSPLLLAETVLRLADQVGGDDGALLVLEDLHWACGDTLAVLEHLAHNVAMERILVLGTSRNEGDAATLIEGLDRRGVATLSVLEPLSDAQTSEMAAACLTHAPGAVPAAVLELLGAQAEGLPFLVEELLAGMVSRGTLVASESGWELRGELGAVDVPLSFSQTMRERMSQLSALHRRVVEFAALMGRDFDWSYLPRIAHADEVSVLEALSRAVDLQLVEDTGGDRFRFRHALTVEAILAEMLDPQRARLAERALDDLVGDREQVAPELLELAAHLADQARLTAESSRYLTEEGRRALASGALATAIATSRRVRARMPVDAPEALLAGELLLSALSLAGDTAAVEEVGAELLSQLEPLDRSRERQATVRLRLAHAAHAALDLERARRLCDEALALEPQDDRLRVELDLMLAEIAFSEHEHRTAVARAEAVLAEADASGFADLACDALELLGRHRMFIALRLLEAEPYLREALRRAELSGLPLTRLRVLQRLAFHDLARGAGAVRMHEGRALALELGALASVAEFDHLLGTYHLLVGEHDRAAACAERALAEARRCGLAELTALVLALRATIAAVSGNREVAERRAGDAAAAAEGLPQMRAAVSGTPLVVAALADDDLLGAAARVVQTRASLPDEIVFWPPFVGSFYGVAAVVLAAAGARHLIERHDWVPLDDVYQRSSFQIARGIVAGRNGDAGQAAELFAAGDERLADVPWIRAMYRRYGAEAALADGWGQPAGWLAEAEAFFEDAGNEALARACRSLLRLAGTSPRRRRSASGEHRYHGLELTTREADVLALLAEGMTNKEIAGRLYLSPRTVEKHVERILSKTGQINRTALAAFAAEQEPVASAT
jgi:DNA-binding CsgD family transcriptional regulator